MAARTVYDDPRYVRRGDDVDGQAPQFRKKKRVILFDGGSFRTMWPMPSSISHFSGSFMIDRVLP